MTTDNQTASDTTAKAAAENDGFQEIVTQRYMYNADECKGTPLVGHLLNMVDMPPMSGRDWSAFVIRTTKATIGLDRDKALVDVPVGAEILIPATYELEQFLKRAATNSEFVYEVKIEPNKKLDIGGGKTMWLYKLGAKPQPQKRRAFGLAAVLGALPAPKAEGAADSDIAW